jgi:peptide-methionine (S)-S-oxide reductase
MRSKLLATAIIWSIAALWPRATFAAEPVLLAPPPGIDMPLATTHGSETAILSGGCFWGMQAVFQHVRGVREAIAGYTGGAADTAQYEDVSTGTSGHAESLKIIFDPGMVSFGMLLRIFVSVAANPTELDYQGPDSGSQYRSEIWVETPEQRHIAEAYIRQLSAGHTFTAPIVTRIDDATPFYPAEGYHQNYAVLHPDSLYIATYDAPKVTALAQLFPNLYRQQPVLVRTGDEQPGGGQ